MNTSKSALLLTLLSWLLLLAEQFNGPGWLSALVPWVPLALTALAVVILLRTQATNRRPQLVACASVLIGAAALVPLAGNDEARFEKAWRRSESASVVQTLLAVGGRVQRLQALSSSIGEQTAAFALTHSEVASDSLLMRFEMFRHLEDVAARIEGSGELPPGTHIGLHLFSADGRRVAWAGWPQVLLPQDETFIKSDKETIYSSQVSLYQILRHMIPIRDDSDQRVATLLIDMPLEVNYKVNNRFLQSTSFVDDISAAAADIRFDYYPTDPNLPRRIERYAAEMIRRAERAERKRQSSVSREQRADSVMTYAGFPAEIRPIGEITGEATSGLSGRALVHSRLGNPLFTASVLSRPHRFYVDTMENRLRTILSVMMLATLLIYVVLFFNAFGRRSGYVAAIKAAYVIAVLVLTRYWLLSLVPRFIGGQPKMFDPAIFATPFMGGLMRSAGDLLITALFLVAALWAVLRIMRPATRPLGAQSFTRWFFVAKGVLAAVVLYAAYEIGSRFVHSVVVNANPRLLGEAMRLFESYAAFLHVSVFLMMSGIFLAATIGVWGLYRLGGAGDGTRASWVAAVVSIVISLLLWRWEVAFILLLLLLFVTFAPRLAQREDLVSVVGVAFGFVIIVSAAAYVFLNEDYQGLRRTFIQEKVAELTHPSDNWKVFILEDVLEELSQDSRVRRALTNPASSDLRSVAFDLWAQSSLSFLGYSSAVHVFNGQDSLVSHFAVEMPYRVRLSEATERLETASDQEWVVLDLTTSTPNGIVRFYRGIVNIAGFASKTDDSPTRRTLGKVVVDIPFFFESLSWASRTGPQTPEVLRNVQEGGIAPRLEETEALLLARLNGPRVLETSSDVLPVGFTFANEQLDAATALEWPILTTRGQAYRYLILETENAGQHLLAGFPVPQTLQHVLRWSTLLSLYFFFTVSILLVIVLLRGLPVVSRLLPSLTPGRQLGFQQKILGSFLVIALLPSIILGVFSIRLIKDRFVQENRKEALGKALSAQKSFANLLGDELNYLIDHTDLRDLTSGAVPRYFANDRDRRIAVLNDRGAVIGVDSTATSGAGDGAGMGGRNLDTLVERFAPEQVFVHWWKQEPFLAMLSHPVDVFLEGEGQRKFTIYYARRIDGELLAEIAEQVGADLNVYHGGDLVASSRQGLLFGGFISAAMNTDAYAKVSLMGVDRTVASESAGDYHYEVAYVPIRTEALSENAALGVPLLFRPESFQVEVQKATSIVLGVFALLSAVTIGLGLLLARGIFEPLKGLLEGTRRISRGDLTVRLPSKRRDEIGTVVEAFNEMTDQLSRSRTALDERRRYLEVILANIGTGVLSTDADNRIRAVNNAAERILGITEAAMLGRGGEELEQGELAHEFFALLSKGSSEEEPFVSSEISITRDDHTRTIKYMRTRLSTDGRDLGTVYVFEDLTELINSKKLSAWVEMSRQIAHEIKNPLTPIKLSTQFMVKAYEEEAEDFDGIFKESAGTIIQQVEVLRRIASEFSSFGRLQELELAPQDVIPQLQDIIGPYRKNSTGVEISLDYPVPHVEAITNPEGLRKICTNLIENAMEAMPDGGRLDVSCSTAVVDKQEQVVIAFRDSGPGLRGDVQGKLFEPYFSTKTTGTGLGLAICRRLSREMGGDVVLRNLEGGRGVEAALYLRKV
jgi:PAS domain S-box-containing protein